MQKFVPRIHVVIFATNTSDPPHLTINSFFGVLYSVWVHLGSFRNCMKLDAKQGELEQLMQKFVPQSRIGIFCDESTRSTPLDPKLMFWCVSYHLGVFGTIMLPYETRGKTGRTSAKVRATKSRQNFSQQTHSIHSIGPQNHVLVHFVPFGCIWDYLVALRNSVQNGPN